MIEIGNVIINNEQIQYLKEWTALVIMEKPTDASQTTNDLNVMLMT